MKKKLLIITGPTASGKTRIAISCAKMINAQIICADSRIVYKDLDIVSAKPSTEEQDGIKHHLTDICNVYVEFSAGNFVEHSKNLINEIHGQNQNVIICGGTWFYIKSLLDDKKLPPSKPNPQLRKALSELTNEVLWEKLNTLDYKRAQKIHPNNRDKIIRSIEICECLNEPISDFSRENNEKYYANWFMPVFDRSKLYERIDKRVDEMIEAGLYEEWQKNKEKYPNSKVMYNTIGYKEFYDLEEGIWSDFKTAVDKIKQHTRNFAKRQLTFFNNYKLIKPIKSVRDMIEEWKNV